MIKSKQLIGLPVVSITEGKKIGKVKELVANPASKFVAALIIEKKGIFKEQKFIPYSNVSSIGDDAITIEKSSSAKKGTNLPEIVHLARDKHPLIGCKVVAENGSLLGVVEEYYIDTKDGSLSGFEISGNFINSIMSGRAFLDISLVRTIGKKILVSSNDASENLIRIDGGLWETLKAIKDTGSSLWESTVIRAKEVTGSLNKRLEQIKAERNKDSEHVEQCECSSCKEQRTDNTDGIKQENIENEKVYTGTEQKDDQEQQEDNSDIPNKKQ
ncbi:MAG: PRC-barrel domain-containing protein [Desulfotomaculum sp.]|nr:PRC-barrel domain-containing protein [Desulfotomaculum sp.]